MRSREKQVHLNWQCNLVQLLWRPMWQYLLKLNIHIFFIVAILILAIYPTDIFTQDHKDSMYKDAQWSIICFGKILEIAYVSIVGNLLNRSWYCHSVKHNGADLRIWIWDNLEDDKWKKQMQKNRCFRRRMKMPGKREEDLLHCKPFVLFEHFTVCMCVCMCITY